MDKIIALVALVGVLVIVSRGLPGRSWPAVIAATLAVILLVVLAERFGYWPKSWRVR